MDWSYIAGFFDGEGNFHLVFTKRSIQLVCRMYGESTEAFREMIRFMGFGKIYSRKNSSRVPELTIVKKGDVENFLKNIIPFLVIKKEHAKFLLSEYSFERNNNLDLDLEKFYTFVKRRNANKLRSKNRTKEIELRKKHLLS